MKNTPEQEIASSELKFRNLFDYSRDACLLLHDGKFIDCNQAAADSLHAKSIDDVINTSPWEISPEFQPDGLLSRTKAKMVIEKAIETGSNRFEWIHRHLDDGVEFPVEVSLAALPDGIIYVDWHNITERKRTEATLRDSEEKYRALVNNLSSGMVVHAPDSTIIFSNPMASTLLGLTSAQMLGKDSMNAGCRFLRENGVSMPLAEYPVNRVLSSGEPMANQVLGIHRPDLPEPVWVQCNAYPVTAVDGTLLQVVVTFSDITALKAYEKELREKNAELERFTYTVSHDLKSPIITIKGFTGSLQKDLVNGNYDRMADDLKRVSDAADKMNNLLRDLLELSTIGRVIKAPEPVDMNLLVSDVLTLLAGSLKSHNLTVTVQPNLPTVECDRHRMGEVVQNLLENAINYIGDQPEPKILFGMREEDGVDTFFVQDNGIGIDEKYHRVIFGLFNKLDSSSAGTGIGLALVKRIIEVHGGRVWVESEGEGMGSRFCFTVK